MKQDDRAAQFLQFAKEHGCEENARELVEDLAFLEEQMQELRKLPFIKVDPKNPERQKGTAAAKQYKDLLQQYNNSLKLFLKMCGDLDDDEAESPLRAWAKAKTQETKANLRAVNILRSEE